MSQTRCHLDRPPHARPRRSRPARVSRAGFTLVEIIVASIIVALMAGATTVAISRSVKTRDAAQARYEAFSSASAAVDLIAKDLQNAARDETPTHVRVAVTSGGTAEFPSDSLMLLARSARPTRIDPQTPDSPVHEVQYRLESAGLAAAAIAPAAAETQPTLSSDSVTKVLWRRDDPLPDEYLDGGGVASPVVTQIKSISIEATDGATWFETWDSDADGMPHAVRVTITAGAGSPERIVVARRTIALDRTPLPDTAGTTPQAPAEGANPTTQGTNQQNTQQNQQNANQQNTGGGAGGGGRGGRGGRPGDNNGGGGRPGTGPGGGPGQNPGTGPGTTPGQGPPRPPGGGFPGGGPPAGGGGGGGGGPR